LEEILGQLVGQSRQLAQSLIAVQTTCAALISEVCRLHPDPKHQMIRITSFFAGIAYGGAATEGHGGDAVIDTSAVTAVMEPITRLAEHGLLRA